MNPLNAKGAVEGRFAFIDLQVEGRWGGFVTGDRVSMDFSPHEPGLKAPVVRTFTRCKDLPESDDKETCAGTMDAYVRGALDEAA